MAEYEGVPLQTQGSPAPPNDYGGSRSIGLSTGTLFDFVLAFSGDAWVSHSGTISLGTVAGFMLDLSGDEYGSAPFILQPAQLNQRMTPVLGDELLGRALRLDKVYRSADRITYVGYALDQTGNPLRQYQLQFIGQTVQENFSGTATDLTGVFVAYLTVGDTYTAFAFDPKAGFVYELVSIVENPNSVTLTFRLKTKRGGFGEGIFLGSY